MPRVWVSVGCVCLAPCHPGAGLPSLGLCTARRSSARVPGVTSSQCARLSAWCLVRLYHDCTPSRVPAGCGGVKYCQATTRGVGVWTAPPHPRRTPAWHTPYTHCRGCQNARMHRCASRNPPACGTNLAAHSHSITRTHLVSAGCAHCARCVRRSFPPRTPSGVWVCTGGARVPG